MAYMRCFCLLFTAYLPILHMIARKSGQLRCQILPVSSEDTAKATSWQRIMYTMHGPDAHSACIDSLVMPNKCSGLCHVSLGSCIWLYGLNMDVPD